MKKLLTTSQAAKILGVHKKTLQRGKYDKLLLAHRDEKGWRWYHPGMVENLAPCLAFSRSLRETNTVATQEYRDMADPAKRERILKKLSTGAKNNIE